MKSKILLLTLALVFSLAVSAQTSVSAIINTNQVWTSSGSPYLIGQNTYIDTNGSVKVGPGVTVQFTGNYKLMIDGEFQAVGTNSSKISILKAQLDFRDGSADYDDSTGSGAFFEHCYITGYGSGSRAISYRNTSMKFSYCEFDSVYYGIYGNSNGYNKLVIENSKFQGMPNNYGYPVYTSGPYNDIRITGSEFSNAYNIYAYGATLFENNTVDNMQATNLYLYQDAVIKCNTFTNMVNGLNLGLVNQNYAPKLDITFNTFDSIGASVYSYMLRIYKSSASYVYDYVTINYNNFLTTSGVTKVEIYGPNPSPGSSDTLDLTNNYWSTTSYSAVDSFIKDYNDDITIFAQADYSNLLSQPQTTCTYSDPCPIANFQIQQEDTVLVFYDSSWASNGYVIDWYVDGTHVGSGGVFTYTESTPGTYYVCLVIEDTINNCIDSSCHSFTISGSSTSCHASFYLAIDTNNLYNLYLVNNSTGTTSSTNYIWSFGDGTGSTSSNPTHQYASFGLYQLCLTLEDSAAGCYSTYCDSIGMDSTGAVLKKAAFTIKVIDESVLLSVNTPNNVSEFNIYPNPTTGKITLDVNANMANEMNVVVYNTVGQEVYTSNVLTKSGNNKISIDLSDELNGMYMIQLRSDNGMVTKRVLLNK